MRLKNTRMHMHVSRVGFGCGPHTHEMILDQLDHCDSNELLKTIPILASRSQSPAAAFWSLKMQMQGL